MYKITIEKCTLNDKYKEPGPRMFNYTEQDPTENMKYLIEKSLETEITDEEFQVIKRSCLEIM